MSKTALTDVATVLKRLGEHIRVLHDRCTDHEVRARLVVLLEEFEQSAGIRHRLHRYPEKGMHEKVSLGYTARLRQHLRTPSSKAIAYMPSGASVMSLSPLQWATVK